MKWIDAGDSLATQDRRDTGITVAPVICGCAMRSLAVSLAVVFVTLDLNASLARGDPSATLVGRIARHVVASGESLRSIGARFGVDPSTLAADNDIKRQVALRIGQELIVDNRHIVPSPVADGMIIVNIPQRMLFFRPGDRLFSAPIAVGSVGWKTPQSPFTILVRETDPTWDVPESIAIEARARGLELPAKVPPGPGNPLGRHWLGLSMGGIGIHGTNAPSSVYGAVTHGCIRMHPDDIAVLFDLVGQGTPGRIIYEPILLAEDGEQVFLEVHPDVYRRNSLPALVQVRALATRADLTERIDWTRAEQVASLHHGIARDVTRRSWGFFPAAAENSLSLHSAPPSSPPAGTSRSMAGPLLPCCEQRPPPILRRRPYERIVD